MKVLHVINNLGSGGAEKLLEEIISRFNKGNIVEADILLLTDETSVYYKSLINKGVKVYVIKYRNMYDFRNIFEIYNLINEGNYNIVHSHTFPTQMWVALAKICLRNKKVKFITTEHSTHNRRREKKYFRPIDKFVYAQYDSIVSITKNTKENLIKWINPNQKNIHKYNVIENGIDIKGIEAALPYQKRDLIKGINYDTTLVCMVGRFSLQKDQPTLIKAVSKLPEDVHLILVGEGPLISENKALAKELKIEKRVHFLGFRQDVHKILKTVDIVVLSSHWEGFGLAAVEGMAAKKPLLASNVDGLSEIVFGSGVLFENENNLTDSINLLINDKLFYSEISQACYYRAKNYDIVAMVNKLSEMYLDII